MKAREALLQAFSSVHTPEGLCASIVARIAQAQRRSARIKTLLLSIASVLFGVALVPALGYASQELYASGFYEYMSLLFSDHTLVLSAWREFGFSLFESLPSIAVLLITFLVGALLWSVRRTFVNAKIAFTTV